MKKRLSIGHGQVQRAAWYRSMLAVWVPPALFLPVTIPLALLLVSGWVAGTDWPGNDAALYRSAAAEWLAGGDPWSVGDDRAAFAGSPLTVLAFVPFVPIPEPVFRLAAVGVSWAAAAWLIRHLRLRWYWLAYPPLVAGAMVANPGVVCVALALTGAAAISPILKSFMALPLLGERALASLGWAAGALMVSVVLAPGLWSSYISQFGDITHRLIEDLHYSGTIYQAPWVLPLGLVGLATLTVVDARAACWLAIPAIWPGMEYHYAILALPVAPAVAVVLTANSASLATAVIGVYGLARFALAARGGRSVWLDRVAKRTFES